MGGWQWAQCRCLWRHGLLLANDPHRRLWHSLNLPAAAVAAYAASALAITSSLGVNTANLAAAAAAARRANNGVPPLDS